jgi:hypothetical protein
MRWSPNAGAALLRGAYHVLHLLMPYLEPGQRASTCTCWAWRRLPTPDDPLNPEP